MIGALCSRSWHTARWTLGFGYRFQPSSRHFIGTVEQKQREINHTQIQNTYHLMDFSLNREISKRWSANINLPLVFAYRNQLYVPRGEFRVNAIGDITLGPRFWVFKPPTESGANIGIGVNLKLPTGKYNAMGAATDRAGRPIMATADQSIQAGDGGTGFSFDFQAFRPVWTRYTLYMTGAYLFNPRDINGVSTFRTRRGEEVMSVTDQYLWRGGIAALVPKLRNFSVSFGGRMEGVPVRDLLGKSNGFRRPGYAISLDPGLMYAKGRSVFSVGVPFAIERNRRRSVTDIANGFHGDAAFADYALIFGLSRRF